MKNIFKGLLLLMCLNFSLLAWAPFEHLVGPQQIFNLLKNPLITYLREVKDKSLIQKISPNCRRWLYKTTVEILFCAYILDVENQERYEEGVIVSIDGVEKIKWSVARDAGDSTTKVDHLLDFNFPISGKLNVYNFDPLGLKMVLRKDSLTLYLHYQQTVNIHYFKDMTPRIRFEIECGGVHPCHFENYVEARAIYAEHRKFNEDEKPFFYYSDHDGKRITPKVFNSYLQNNISLPISGWAKAYEFILKGALGELGERN
jgi:hypothetical protein